MEQKEVKKIENLNFTNDIEKLEKLVDIANEKSFISIEQLFKDALAIELEEKKYKHFLNGVKLTQKKKKDGVYRIYLNQKFIGIGKIEKELLKREIIIK